jgi:tetratricopeptide (TPR) repeat protein
LLLKSIRSADQAHRRYQELPDGPIARIGKARANLAQARANRDRKLLPEGQKLYRKTIVELDSILGADPDSHAVRRWLAQAHFELGQTLDQPDQRSDAIAAHRQALKIRLKLVQDEPNSPIPRAELAESRLALARSLAGSPVRAAGQVLLAIADRTRVLALAPGMTENRRELRRLSANSLKTLMMCRKPNWTRIGARVQRMIALRLSRF